MRIFFLFAALLSASAAASPVDFVFRNAKSESDAERRTFLLQGRRDQSFLFPPACGSGGERCTCLYYQGVGDTNPQPLRANAVLAEKNVLVCALPPGNLSPAAITHMGVRLGNGNMLVPRTEVKTQLALADILGPLPPGKARSVWRYACERRFFEGEGFAQMPPACPAAQHLGLLTAFYSYFVYRSAEGQSAPAGDLSFLGPLCEKSDLAEFHCLGAESSRRFGLYGDSVAPFTVRVELAHGPREFAQLYGYAALPDRTGTCPLGLVAARPWLARPSSIVEGGIDGKNPPSSFLNSRRELDSVIWDPEQPAPFEVLRQANASPCDSHGSCERARFGEAHSVQHRPYLPISPVLCVIPPEALLF